MNVETWTETTMGAIGNYINGRTFNEKEWASSGKPIIRIQNLTGTSEEFNYFAGEVDPRYEIKRGDLLFSWAATLGTYFWNGPDALLNQHIFKVDSHLRPKFHKYLLDYKIQEMYRQAHGTGMVHITKKIFEALPVSIPSSDLQDEIVEILDEFMHKIENALSEVSIAELRLEALQRQLYDSLANGSLVSNEDLMTSVEHWRKSKFGEIATIDADLRQTSQFPDLPHIAPNNIEKNTGKLLEYRTVREDGVISAKHYFRPGSILYSKIRPYLNKVVLADFEGLCSADMYPISTNQNIRWLHFMMLSPTFVTKAAGNQNRTVLPKINSKELRNIEVLVPPIEIQEQLVNRVDTYESLIRHSKDAVTKTRTEITSLRNSVLHAALTGQLTQRLRNV